MPVQERQKYFQVLCLEKGTDNYYEWGSSYIPAAWAQRSGEGGQQQRLAAGRGNMQSARQDLNGSAEQPTATRPQMGDSRVRLGSQSLQTARKSMVSISRTG